MYRKTVPGAGKITQSYSIEGETIEQKVSRIVNNGDAITDGAPLIFTERKDGVLPEYDPRTDRWDVAVEAMDKVTASRLARRDNVVEMPKKEGKSDGGAEPVEGTSK